MTLTLAPLIGMTQHTRPATWADIREELDKLHAELALLRQELSLDALKEELAALEEECED